MSQAEGLGGYTAQGKSCPSVLRVEVSAVMLEVFPLWAFFCSMSFH